MTEWNRSDWNLLASDVEGHDVVPGDVSWYINSQPALWRCDYSFWQHIDRKLLFSGWNSILGGMDVCVDPSILVPHYSLGGHRSTKLQLYQEKKTKQNKTKQNLLRSKFEFRFLFRKWCYSLNVPLYFLTSSWPNNQLLAGIAFSSVSFIMFCMLKIISVYLWHFFPQDIKVTYAPSTSVWSQPDCHLNIFSAFYYSNLLFLSIPGMGQSLWKKSFRLNLRNGREFLCSELTQHCIRSLNDYF